MIAALALTAALAMPVEATPPQPPAACKDSFARMLWDAGFKGQSNRVAWSITYRESRHQNLVPGHPSFNGSDWGAWQINAPSHAGSSWWSTAAMSDPRKQSRVVYKYLSRKGTFWQPWGINRAGDGMDTTQYGMWSPSTQYAWIWSGYAEGLRKYPRGCDR